MEENELRGAIQQSGIHKVDPIYDSVNHPQHYLSHPSGIECIEITRHHNFDIGNAIKYLWRAGLKKEEGMTQIDKEIEDLNKAVWYINDRLIYLEALRAKESKYGKL